MAKLALILVGLVVACVNANPIGNFCCEQLTGSTWESEGMVLVFGLQNNNCNGNQGTSGALDGTCNGNTIAARYEEVDSDSTCIVGWTLASGNTVKSFSGYFNSTDNTIYSQWTYASVGSFDGTGQSFCVNYAQFTPQAP